MDEPNPDDLAAAAAAAFAPDPVKDLLRFTSERLPYRRAGLVFAGSRVLDVPASEVTREQALEIYADPVIKIEFSTDAGETWRDLPEPEPEAEAALTPTGSAKTK